jgi:hypothetical protein
MDTKDKLELYKLAVTLVEKEIDKNKCRPEPLGSELWHMQVEDMYATLYRSFKNSQAKLTESLRKERKEKKDDRSRFIKA